MTNELHRNIRGALALSAALLVLFLWQQKPAIGQSVVHRIGFLGLRPLSESEALIGRLRAGLQDLGYVEGKNYVLDIRLADDNASRYPALVRELTDANVKLIVAANIPAAVAIHQINPQMMIVIAQGPDIVGNKLADSVERPGGVATGLEELKPGMTDKRLRLLKQARPAISRIAVLSPTPSESGHAVQYREAEQTAAAIGVTLRPYRVSAATDFDKVFDAIMRDGADGVVVLNGLLPRPIQLRIVGFATERRLPVIYASEQFVVAGGLMSYGADQPERFRLAASIVDKILKGTKPGDLPLTYDAQLRLFVNTRAAESIGMTLPQSLIAEAHTVLK
jgi:putative ABC transport system substrate-binding protein